MPKKKRRRKKRVRLRGKYLSTKMNVEMTYRSGWELQYFRYLDSNDDVVAFFSEPFKLPYLSNKKSGKVRNYIPDLLVRYQDGTQRLIEIKPRSRLMKAVNVKKFNAATLWCNSQGMTFCVVTEVELKALGLLK